MAVFEATARHASFKQAADELNVTTGAISRQIKALEDELGVKLFTRGTTGVNLTPTGQDLFSEIAAAFSRCSEAIWAAKSGQREESVTFACTDAFATFWLMPRMVDFWTRHPTISVNYLISEQTRDFRNAEVDLFVRSATGAWPNENAEPLFEDSIYPVCGVGFAIEHQGIHPSELSRLPLLHMDWTNPDWPLWQDFLQAASVPSEGLRGKRFGKYAVLLTAAEANQGVALGWDSLVRPLIEEGRLVRLTELSMRDPVGFCLAWNSKKRLSESAVKLKAWLVEQAQSGMHVQPE
ncbi:LysR family transcriptional regulator [Mesorhizobium sp. CA8]|uniref:LysR substrate-binding domain-containing protein n=1 Tax=unclassified Mesorhizobium TaxID=325217 RepID=UPI001CC95914|nr:MULTISPECIES: LysR substrate-binding domain-containing protein [unclassified Mesorhizobium]MBZ9764973.1 LysR family transcriptional regulator [Mesorhizobium sp. CA8]MBZ9823621.1 LysR family transcriptional regulator [Mesorhizobium sp. CA4]